VAIWKNSGNDLELSWYNASGVYQSSPIIIDEATGYITLNVPTSSSGLISGQIYSNSGVLTIV
jgi:hypothetical protein